jgi:4-hydroxybenzoate polyprenyltransferase
MAAHTALGLVLATGFHWPDRLGWLGLVAWVVALNGGTLALNSAFDRDEDDVAYLHRPPPVPPGLATISLALMVLGLLLTWRAPVGYRWAYGLCAVLSILYSVPPFRLKAVGGADWVINIAGFGVISPYAGWALSGRPLTAPVSAIFLGFGALFAAFYPLTQLYQIDVDRARGDQTLAIRLGVQRSLAVAVLGVGVAFGMITGAGLVSGWGGVGAPLRWALLGLAGLAWIVVLAPWYLQGRGWSSAEHQRGMYHALLAWALTDVAVVVAWAA